MSRLAPTLAVAFLAGCGTAHEALEFPEMNYVAKVDDYVPIKLEADLTGLSDRQRAMLPLLAEAAQIMDDVFWHQAFGEKDEMLSAIVDPDARRFAEINYGPWDRLDDNQPFLRGFGPKPPGANFYPTDMTKEEFDAAAERDPSLRSQYTLVRRDSDGKLVSVPYHEAYSTQVTRASELLLEAAGMAEDDGFRHYLEARATALESSHYQPSDFAWMEMRNNDIDLVIGPIESYEDKLFGSKTAFEAFLLIKDRDWSKRLEKYSAMLPILQRGLPVPPAYKSEEPGSDSQLNAYEVIYYAGDCNAGAKTIAINLPNDEQVQLEKGSRRLQLKNAMRAKFDNILVPIASIVIAEDQRSLIEFDAFFTNTMFHEVAHGLGIKNVLDGSKTVREALREASSALEEAKADILGLHLVGRLTDSGDLPDNVLESNFVTFLAGIFRSVRFGASSAHGIANTLSFNYLQRAEAFRRDEDTGNYRVDTDKMRAAVDALSGEILQIQGDGDYERATAFLEAMGRLSEPLEGDLTRIEEGDIPIDVVFEQDFAF